MLCLMHQGSPYGHLKVNDKVITDIQLARMVGGELQEVKLWLLELIDSGVCSVNDDQSLMSRRMVKDESFRRIRADGGKLGGNPKLMGGYNKPGFVYAMLRASDGAVKIGISQDPAKRLYKVRAQYPETEITVLQKLYVEDMGKEEALLHDLFSQKKSGEWFCLDEGELSTLLEIHLKAKSNEKVKAKQTPSSSSSSSSSRNTQHPPPDGVSSQVWNDFLELRKAKKAKLTATALEGIRREAEKAQITLEAALAMCCMRGWTGFKADWLARSANRSDTAEITVPGRQGIDPALAKVIADAAKAAPPSAEIRARLEAIRNQG